MNARILSQIVVAILLVVGITAIWSRYNARRENVNALEDARWRLRYSISFEAEESDTEVRIALPATSELLTIEAEPRTISPKMDEKVVTLVPSGTRELIARTSELGEYSIGINFDLRLRETNSGTRAKVQLSPKHRSRYLRDETDIPAKLTVVKKALENLPSNYKTDEQKLEWIFNFCMRDLKRAASGTTSDSVYGSLVDGRATPLGRTLSFVTLCRAAGYPARRVIGFELRQQSEVEPHVWAEVFKGSRWVPFDPENGFARRIPNHFIPIRVGSSTIVRAPRANELKEKYSLVRMSPSEEALLSDKQRASQILDLTRLPVKMHEVLSLLLLLPFGALITAFFRNVIGIRTFGTFAPALLAVSFIYADLLTGLIVLVLVFGAGLLSRLFVDRLQLLLVPRLSILLTTIILFVVTGISLLDYYKQTTSTNAVLLPLVILTILIERCYVTVEEDGLGHAIQLVMGTFLVSSCCYLLLRWEDVGEAILIYPEAHLLTLAAFVAIGRYSGYRISEMWRFRDMVDITA